jgi:hypothetical protein
MGLLDKVDEKKIAETVSKYPLVLLAVAAVIFTIVFLAYPAVSLFLAGLLKAAIGLALWWGIDRYILKKLDTQEELKNGNTAFALFSLGFFIVIAAAIIAS